MISLFSLFFDYFWLLFNVLQIIFHFFRSNINLHGFLIIFNYFLNFPHLWQSSAVFFCCKSNAAWACNAGCAVSGHSSLHRPGAPKGWGMGGGGWTPEMGGRWGGRGRGITDSVLEIVFKYLIIFVFLVSWCDGTSEQRSFDTSLSSCHLKSPTPQRNDWNSLFCIANTRATWINAYQHPAV